MKNREPLQYIKEGAICAEIGVWKGDFSTDILKKKPSKLHLIDPWVHQDYDGRLYCTDQKTMDDIYRSVQSKFACYKEVTIHRDFSTNVNFSKEYFDWAYIDANHDYGFVLQDLYHYYPLIKKGGMICGDDYGWSDSHCSAGPKKAVDEFAESMCLEKIIKYNQFMLNKA